MSEIPENCQEKESCRDDVVFVFVGVNTHVLLCERIPHTAAHSSTAFSTVLRSRDTFNICSF